MEKTKKQERSRERKPLDLLGPVSMHVHRGNRAAWVLYNGTLQRNCTAMRVNMSEMLHIPMSYESVVVGCQRCYSLHDPCSIRRIFPVRVDEGGIEGFHKPLGCRLFNSCEAFGVRHSMTTPASIGFSLLHYTGLRNRHYLDKLEYARKSVNFVGCTFRFGMSFLWPFWRKAKVFWASAARAVTPWREDRSLVETWAGGEMRGCQEGACILWPMRFRPLGFARKRDTGTTGWRVLGRPGPRRYQQ